MSFEFDPNENIARAEDDNDPQDIESLGGEGLFGRVPGGPQGEAANRSHGQPLGDQGLPLGRQGQAQAHHGLGQARGGKVPRSAGQAPGLLGMLGRVPSQVSLAASAAFASVIPTSGYFGSQKRQAVEIMPVGSFAPSMLKEPMAHKTMLVIKRLFPRLSLTPLLQQSIFMLKMQKVKPQISMPTPVQIRKESCQDQDPQAAYGRLGHD